MFAHNKRLQYSVHVSEGNPALANLMLEQFGGPQGELAAAMRYFTQALAEDDPGRKDMLLDIATEELSHLEARAKIVYERLINVTDDPGVKAALGFLMTREVAHQQSFEKALYSIQPNFPPGKAPPIPEFANAYVNTSQGEGEMRGSWNSDENFNYISDREAHLAMDGGDGLSSVKLKPGQKDVLKQMATRTKSDPAIDPPTGAELGMGGKSKPRK